MRYHSIANRQPILGCLFFLLLSVSCKETTADKKRSRLEASSVLIEYAGDQRLAHGDFIQINGKLFFHDSLYVFHRKSIDTAYLPTQRYVADQPVGGRPVYATSNAISCLINMAEVLLTVTDTTQYKLDLSRIQTGQIRIQSVGKQPVEVIASGEYPLRITAVKN
jgi:hypothetical protein